VKTPHRSHRRHLKGKAPPLPGSLKVMMERKDEPIYPASGPINLYTRSYLSHSPHHHARDHGDIVTWGQSRGESKPEPEAEDAS
jgi:hypothetical protein